MSGKTFPNLRFTPERGPFPPEYSEAQAIQKALNEEYQVTQTVTWTQGNVRRTCNATILAQGAFERAYLIEEDGRKSVVKVAAGSDLSSNYPRPNFYEEQISLAQKIYPGEGIQKGTLEVNNIDHAAIKLPYDPRNPRFRQASDVEVGLEMLDIFKRTNLLVFNAFSPYCFMVSEGEKPKVFISDYGLVKDLSHESERKFIEKRMPDFQTEYSLHPLLGSITAALVASSGSSQDKLKRAYENFFLQISQAKPYEGIITSRDWNETRNQVSLKDLEKVYEHLEKLNSEDKSQLLFSFLINVIAHLQRLNDKTKYSALIENIFQGLGGFDGIFKIAEKIGWARQKVLSSLETISLLRSKVSARKTEDFQALSGTFLKLCEKAMNEPWISEEMRRALIPLSERQLQNVEDLKKGLYQLERLLSYPGRFRSRRFTAGEAFSTYKKALLNLREAIESQSGEKLLSQDVIIKSSSSGLSEQAPGVLTFKKYLSGAWGKQASPGGSSEP